MLALMPRFIVSESAIDEMTKPANLIGDSSDVNLAANIKYFLEVASNLMLYCRNAVANHSVDHRCANILFSPSMNEALQQNERAGGFIEIAPSLGVVVSQLKNTVDYHNKQKSNYDNLLRKKTTMSNNSLDLTSKYKHLCRKCVILNIFIIVKQHDTI